MVFWREEGTMGKVHITETGVYEDTDSFSEWAKSKVGCSVCQQSSAASRIRELLELKAKGESNRSYRELYDWLVKYENFKGGRTTLQEHMKRCEPELKEAADERALNRS
jgi:hypothetical protein